MRTAYLDASVIIYLVEGLAGARELVARRIAGVEADPEGRIITATLPPRMSRQTAARREREPAVPVRRVLLEGPPRHRRRDGLGARASDGAACPARTEDAGCNPRRERDRGGLGPSPHRRRRHGSLPECAGGDRRPDVTSRVGVKRYDFARLRRLLTAGSRQRQTNFEPRLQMRRGACPVGKLPGAFSAGTRASAAPRRFSPRARDREQLAVMGKHILRLGPGHRVAQASLKQGAQRVAERLRGQEGGRLGGSAARQNPPRVASRP